MKYRDKIKRLGGEEHLTDADIDDFNDAEKGILRMMLDGEWHNKDEIRAAGHGQEEALRRMRDLRKLPFVETIQTRRSGLNEILDGIRMFEYRLVLARGWRVKRYAKGWNTSPMGVERLPGAPGQQELF